MAYIFVNVNRSVGTINPNIYGQFSEHLVRINRAYLGK